MSTPVWDDARVARGLETQLAARRERLAAGERPLGWKLAFGAPAAMEKLGLSGPATGFMTDRSQLPSGTAVRVDGWTKPVLEPEIAIHLGADLDPGGDEDAARAAIAGLGAAIEIADMDQPPDELESVIATNIYHRGVILGPVRAGADLAGVTVRVLRDGEEIARQADPESATGSLVALTRHVADLLGACGERLRAGEVIISGSVTPLQFPAAGDELVVEMGALGTLSARFE